MDFYSIFKILSSVVSIYMFACIIRVILTWFPQANYSGFGRFLAQACDPYLNLFKKLPLRIGNLDFSAAIGLCILGAISYIFSSIALSHQLSILSILVFLLSTIWNLFSSILFFLIAILVIRLIVLLVSTKSTYGTFWDSIDRTITPILFKMSSFFYRGKSISFKGSLVIAIIELILLYFIGQFGIRILVGLFVQV